MQALVHPQFLRQKRQYGIESDFDHYVTADQFTTVATDSGAATVSDAAGGIVVLEASDGSVVDNDETYLRSTTELFKCVTNCHIVAECRMKIVEANTDDANCFFGLQNAIAANSLVDDGAGMRTTGDCFAIFKVDGGTVWKAISSVNGTQTITTSTTSVTSGTYFNFRIEVRDVDGGTNVESTFFIDDQPLRDSNGRAIHHTTAMASATEMHVGCGVKNGSANHEKLHVDYIGAWQTPRTA